MGKREEVSKYKPFQAIYGCLIHLAIMHAFLCDTQMTTFDLQFKAPPSMIYVDSLSSQ